MSERPRHCRIWFSAAWGAFLSTRSKPFTCLGSRGRSRCLLHSVYLLQVPSSPDWLSWTPIQIPDGLIQFSNTDNTHASLEPGILTCHHGIFRELLPSPHHPLAVSEGCSAQRRGDSTMAASMEVVAQSNQAGNCSDCISGIRIQSAHHSFSYTSLVELLDLLDLIPTAHENA